MLNKYTIRVTGTRNTPTDMFAFRKQLNFELAATNPMEAFQIVERFVDDYDFVTIGCPRRKGVSVSDPNFVTGTAKVVDGVRFYDWRNS